MALTAEISIVVPPLPENEIWFLNAQAWTNYWRDVSAEADFEPADTVLYVSTPIDASLQPETLTIGDTDYKLITKAMWDNLLARLNVLNAAFEDMRTDLKDAGFITNAQ